MTDEIDDTLTAKQRRFVDEYLIDLNATQAAIRSGYSAKTAKSVGCENLTKPDIAAAIEKAQKKRAERVEVTQDWILSRLVENVDRALQAAEIKTSGKGTGEYKYDGAVANRALELLGKHVGMFTDRVEHSGPNGSPVQIEHAGELTKLSAEERAVIRQMIIRRGALGSEET